MIEQIWITVLACAAMLFTSRTSCILGLISGPAWIYIAVHNGQWGILVISIWYTYTQGQGVYCHWIKK
jgi:hypothetical protein